jgi:trimeric autotransporter adhesin
MSQSYVRIQALVIIMLVIVSSPVSAANVRLGNKALVKNSGAHNVALGDYALFLNRSGKYNVASGYQSLYSNTTGIGNIASGVDLHADLIH